MAITEHVYSTVYVLMAPKTWESITEEDQKLISECMEEANLAERELSRQMDKEAITTLEEQGMSVTYPDKKELIKETQSVRDTYGADYKETLDKIAAAK